MPEQKSNTILVLEDEPAVMRVIVEVLKSMPFVVIPAGSASVARAQFGRHRDEIALLIAARMVRDGSGIDVALDCSLASPAVRIVIASGLPPSMWNDGEWTRFGELVTEGAAVLEKPFLPVTLLRVVNDLMSGTKSQAAQQLHQPRRLRDTLAVAICGWQGAEMPSRPQTRAARDPLLCGHVAK